MQDILWKSTREEVLTQLQTRDSGLSDTEVAARLTRYGPNSIKKTRTHVLKILWRQVTSNVLIVVLSIATLISYSLGQHTSSYYIFAMILLSVGLGFWNEYAAERTVDSLLETISPRATVQRNGMHIEISVADITVGDIVLISQGSIIPADLRLISSHNLTINQSALTGESLPSEKQSDPLLIQPKSLSEYSNIAYMGTTVESGNGAGVVVSVGEKTTFGALAESTTYIKPQTEFEKGLAQFGTLLVKVILILTVVMFGVNALLGHPVLDSLLFALAIAVGLTPELLPVIVTVSLSRGAGVLARHHVIAKQLIAIENLGNMDILCTDKTGTLTEGVIELVDSVPYGTATHDTLVYAALVATTQDSAKTGIDAAVGRRAKARHVIDSTTHIVDEPFDFDRKAMFSVVRTKDGIVLVAKGAPEWILAHCHKAESAALHKAFEALYMEGVRVSVVATKKMTDKKIYSWDDAESMQLLGYLTFRDVPKESARVALQHLKHLNVAVKVITGDNELVAEAICREVGMDTTHIMIGADVDTLTNEALNDALTVSTIIARATPEQKLKVITTLRALGHVVGYMGDGINDIPSLRAADVGISVNTAVDVAKGAASIVLLSKGLDVIAAGVREGRRTFSNTIKYILMSTSSNFGNMFSAAGASFFLPFLPMTPVQILLTNGLYDVSQLGIPTDNVDRESLLKPRHWNIGFIKNYMLFFGPLSSLYDFLTFAILLFVFHANSALFQTGWFIESVMTEILVVFVIRTARTPFFKSKPSKTLLITCFSLIATALCIPFSPFAHSLGFVALPLNLFVTLIALVITYLTLVEFMKHKFLARYSL
jgi:Mg2+-importing ATPase